MFKFKIIEVLQKKEDPIWVGPIWTLLSLMTGSTSSFLLVSLKTKSGWADNSFSMEKEGAAGKKLVSKQSSFTS